MIGFLKESQEIRAVIEYHMFYFPPTRRNGDPVQAQGEHEEYPDPSEFPGYPAPGQCFRDMCFAQSIEIPDSSGSIVIIRGYQDRVEIERQRSLFPAHRRYVMSNYSIGADPTNRGYDSDSPPPLEDVRKERQVSS